MGSQRVPDEKFCRLTSSCRSCVRQTHGAACAALQCAMYGASVVDEIESGPGISGKEFRWQEVTFETITAAARGHEIAGGVNATLGQRKDMVDRGDLKVQRGGAVDAAPAAVTHHGVLNGSLLVSAWCALGALGATRSSWKAGETNVVIVSTPRQFHLAEKATPRNGSRSRSGASRRP